MNDGFAEGYAMGRDSGTNGNNGMGWGGDWAWWIVILLIFGWGNGGWGNGNNGGGGQQMMTGYDFGKLATTNDVATGFATSSQMSAINDIKLGQTDIQQTLCQGFNGVNTAVLQAANSTDREISAVGSQLQNCCCETQRAIDGVNYNMAQNTCNLQNTINSTTRDIIDSQRDGTNAILNFLTSEKISGLQAENAALTAQLSQNAQTNTIINTLRPVATPAYITCSPYQSAYGFYGTNGLGGSGCCGL